MTTITDKKDLPNWFFKKDRYSWLETASLHQIAAEWDKRCCANREYCELEVQVGEINSIEMAVICEDMQPIPNNEEPYSPVTCPLVNKLETGDLIFRTFDLSRSVNDMFDLRHSKLPDVSKGVMFELLIDEATDNEILSALQVLLPNIRKELKKPEPAAYEMNPRIAQLRNQGLFELTDLILWAKFKRKKISNKLLAAIIKSGMHTDREISDFKSKKIEYMLTPRFMDILWMHVEGILEVP
jgi:hypothetical protein